MSKYLELFARAIGMPKPIERSPYELDTDEEKMARIRRREMDSTSKGSPEEKEAPTTESKPE